MHVQTLDKDAYTHHFLSMFFLRPNYKYGDPTEQPEFLDEALSEELNQFLSEVPKEIAENTNGDCNIFDHYNGPHTYLFLLAVTYAVRTMVNGDPQRVTKEMFLAAAIDTKNWPTRGYLMPRIGGEGYYEDRGPEDTMHQLG